MSDQFKPGDWSELKQKAQAAADEFGSYDPAEAEIDFMSAITPAIVLALIAENERLQNLACAVNSAMHAAGMPVGADPAELADVIHGLQVQVATLQSAPNSWQSGYDKGRADGTRARLSELEQERRINAELRAEVEALRAEVALRKAQREAFSQCIDSLHAEMLQKFGGQNPDDMHPVTRRDYDRDMEEIAEYRFIAEASKCDYSEVDAAMGKDAGGHSVENQAETRENTGRDAGGQGEVR